MKKRRSNPRASTNKPKRPRGRPPKAVVPNPDKPKGTPATTDEALAAQLVAIKAKAAAGKPLQNHEARLLRDAWLIEQAAQDVLWSGAEAAAAELGISVGTVRGFGDRGCPGIEPHSPIPKLPVYRWLLTNAHQRGGTPPATSEGIEAAELRIKLAKAAKLEGTLAAEAEDRARQALIQVVAATRHHLLYQLPGTIVEAIEALPDRHGREDCIRRLIVESLQQAQLHGANQPPPADHLSDEPTPPTPEASP